MSNISFTRRCLAPGRRISTPRRSRRDEQPAPIGSRASWSRRCAKAKEQSSWSNPNARLRGRTAALCPKRARCGTSQPVSRRFRQFRRIAGTPGGDRVAVPARAEADRAGGAGHLSGRRIVGFQPRRPRQPPAGRLGRAPGAARRGGRRLAGRPCRPLAGRAREVVCRRSGYSRCAGHFRSCLPRAIISRSR